MADHTNDELLARIEELERRLAQHTVPAGTPAADSPGADIWFLLDRSGSMASIAPDVVRGFDEFFAEQRAQEGDATVTLIQSTTRIRTTSSSMPGRSARCARFGAASSRAVARRSTTRSAGCSTAPSAGWRDMGPTPPTNSS
jgi:hypothetical protein